MKKAFSTTQALLKIMPQTHVLFSTSASTVERTVFWNHWQAYMSIEHTVILQQTLLCHLMRHVACMSGQ